MKSTIALLSITITLLLHFLLSVSTNAEVICNSIIPAVQHTGQKIKGLLDIDQQKKPEIIAGSDEQGNSNGGGGGLLQGFPFWPISESKLINIIFDNKFIQEVCNIELELTSELVGRLRENMCRKS